MCMCRKHSNKDLETVCPCVARQVQLEPTSRRAWAASGMTGGVSKYTGIVQATKDILREEGVRVSVQFFLKSKVHLKSCDAH